MLRHQFFCICLLSTLCWPSPNAAVAIHNDEQNDEAAALETYERFLKVLLGNPRLGTAWDRVYEFHVTRGTIAAFHDALADIAGLADLKSGEDPRSDIAIPPFTMTPDPGKASILVGMLDLQHVRGAAAVAALEHATQLRPDDAIAHWYLGRARILNRQLAAAADSLERAIASVRQGSIC